MPILIASSSPPATLGNSRSSFTHEENSAASFTPACAANATHGEEEKVDCPRSAASTATRVRGDVLGHTPFGNSALLSDLFQVITEERSPSERRLLPSRISDGRVFWRFR